MSLNVTTNLAQLLTRDSLVKVDIQNQPQSNKLALIPIIMATMTIKSLVIRALIGHHGHLNDGVTSHWSTSFKDSKATNSGRKQPLPHKQAKHHPTPSPLSEACNKSSEPATIQHHYQSRHDEAPARPHPALRINPGELISMKSELHI